jgi:hypothetical protein
MADPFDALHTALDAAADALTQVAVQRNRITAQRLIDETVLNVRILATIPATVYGTADDQARVAEAADALVDALRGIDVPTTRRIR